MSYFRWNAGRKRQGTPTLESQPGAHTGATRKVIPGYSDANRIFLDTAAGNDAWTGANPTNSPAGTGPFLTQSAAYTAAGSTKKVILVNSTTLTGNITKPTEATIGTTSSIASSSLTAPVNVWTQAGTPSFAATNIEAVAYSPALNIYVAVGQSGKIATSPDGNVWTQQTAMFSSTQVLDVVWADGPKLFFAGGQNGNFAYSANGTAWTESVIAQVAIAGTSYNINAVLWSEELEMVVCATNGGTIAYSSDYGVTWSASAFVLSGQSFLGGCYASGLNKFFLCAGNGEIYYSTDASNWTAATTPSFGGDAVYWIVYSEPLAKLVAVGGAFATPKIAYSTDGITFTQAGTIALTGARATYVDYSPELNQFVAVGSAGQIAFSSDGDTWTLAGTPSFAASPISDVCWSPLQGEFIAVANAGKIAFSTAFGTTISASVAGFSIQAVQYSGTVTAYNCTLRQPGTTAALSLDSCRVTESGAHISNNAVTATATLVEGDIHYTGVYAAANALDLSLNTIAGTLYIYNGSTTNYERIRDNIIENGVHSSYPVTVTSGNTRGTSSDGTIFGQFCTTSDPLFVDTTDYKLQRALDGYQYDSPMVAASQYYYNQATTQTFRDNGAWSYNESAATYKYQRTFDFLMPATAIGSAIDFVRHNRANLHVSENGTPDAVNTPDSRGEEIVMQFKTLPADHIDFINWLEGQVDMTCYISLSPSLTLTTAVTASGATSAGEAVITITDNSGIDSGDQLTIDGNNYTVLYTYGTTKVVLDRVTTTALTDTESITVKYDTGFGEYQYVPMLERRLSRWYETDENYLRGLQIRFARKLP